MSRLDVISILAGSAEGFKFTMRGEDGTGAEIDWTALTVTVQAIAFGDAVDPDAWETVTEFYTDDDGTPWGYVDGSMLTAARAAAGSYHVRCHVAYTDPPDMDVCVLRVA